MAERELASRYDPSDIERRLYRSWVERGYFHVEAEEADDPYVIVIPPPNVTGALHIGHGLNNTLQDVLIRWRRMKGRDALWVPGTDHAGIATQNVVEREMAEEGLARWDVGREAFVARVWEWVDEYGGRILEQLRSLGCSCDWQRTRFTFDEGLSRAVREVFVRLHEKGLVYRGRYIINWCPRCGTALANDEVEHEERSGKLWVIRYPLADGPGHVTVATTRPETMLGDTGLAVHPDDERYRDVVGGEAILPLVGRRLPIVADAFVDPEFGTGIVKVTPAHDPDDFEIGRRHDLPAVDVMTDDARMGEEAPEAYRGLDRLEARARVVEDLEREGLIEEVREHVHSVGHCYRCGTAVEPRLSLQWFVRMAPLAEPALQAWKEGRLRFHPERYGKVYANWMENIRDWCISRQLWWGHRIPVWYCRDGSCDGEMVVAREAPEACPACGGEVEQDPDVLDTWFSSWLWPFSTLGWPEETEDLEAFYPTHVLVTAEEILFFWVARMVMAGLEFRGELPFSDVVINGTVRDHLGRRMSKSLGNGIDPLEVVELFGADALRFTLVRSAPPGTDLQLDHRDLEASFRVGRNFANKIWNAARFALPHLSEADGGDPGERELELADRWILSRFAGAVGRVDGALERFRFHEAAEAAYAFVWGDFCDWYLELVKGRLEGERGEESRAAAAATLSTVLLGWLRMLHPVMPFVTEEIARRLPGRGEADSLVPGPWPRPNPGWEDPEAEARVGALQELVGAVRNLRSEYNVDPGRRVAIHLREVAGPLEDALEAEGEGARRLAGIETIERGPDGRPQVPGAHAVLGSGADVFLPLADVIDVERERERLTGEVERLRGLLDSTRARLRNEAFLEKAPAEVVEREREKEGSLGEQLDRLLDKRGALDRGR